MAKEHFRSDSQGFLVGEPIALDNFTALWKGIREDVSEIRELLKAGNQTIPKTPKELKKNGEVKSVVARPDQKPQNKTLNKRETVSIPVAEKTAKIERKTEPTHIKTADSPAQKEKKSPKVQKTARPIKEIKHEAKEVAVALAKEESNQRRKDKSRGAVRKEETSNRDKLGRFTAGNSEENTATVSAIAEKIGGGLGKFSDADLGEADPSIKAAQEIAQPISRGWEIVTGSSQTTTGWLKRFFNAFKEFKDNQKKHNKAVASDIDDIAKNGKGSGQSSFSLSAPFLGIGHFLPLLGKFGKKIPLLGGLFTAIGGLFDVFKSENSGASREQKNRIIGGSAGSVGGTVAGGFAGAKLGAAIGSLVGPIGTVIGGIVGSAAGMFFGEQAGKILGQWCADAFNAIKNFDFAGIWNNCITEVQTKWGEVTSAVQTRWDETVLTVKGVFEKAGKFIEDCFKPFEKVIKEIQDWWNNSSFVKKSKEVVNAGVEKVSETYQSIKETASNAFEKVQDGGKKVLNWLGFGSDKAETKKETEEKNRVEEQKPSFVGNLISKTEESLSKAAEKISLATVQLPRKIMSTVSDFRKGQYAKTSRAVSAYDGNLGSISSKYETGGRGVSTISTGKDDYGGASYGTYQLSSRSGTLDRYLKQSGYEEQFAGMVPGSAEFNAKWKELAATDQNFGVSQHNFIKATHYEPALRRLAKSGLDMSGRGKAVQEAIFSTSVQYGSAKTAELFKDALGGMDASKLTDAEIVSALQDRKLAGVDRDFMSSSSGMRAGVARRIVFEKNDLLKLALADTSAVQATGSGINLKNSLAAVSAPSAALKQESLPVPVMPSSPKLAKAEPIAQLLNFPSQAEMSGRGGAVNEVILQDVRDRQIAHIVTGGIV